MKSLPTKPTRILWVSDCPLWGTGFGRVTRELCLRLGSNSKFELACLGWSYDGWPYDEGVFPFTIFPSPSATDSNESFSRAVNEFKPDIVVTLGEIWMVDWIAKHQLRNKFKWIAYFPVDSGPFYPPWESILKNPDGLVAMSQFGRNVLQEGLPNHPIHVVLHGVDTNCFRPLPERPALKSMKRIAGKFVIGCVARNQPRKNIPSLIKAFAKVKQKISDLHLFLHMNAFDVGYDLVTLLKRFKLEGSADLANPELGPGKSLTDDELNRLYNVFDITAIPSFGEGFGLPIVESMAAGIPVMATDYSACTELVKGHGELIQVLTTVTMGTNLLEQAVIDVDDLAACIEKLYCNPELVKQYSIAGRAFAESIHWDNLIPQWIAIINAVSRQTTVPGRNGDLQLEIAANTVAPVTSR